MPRKGLRTVTYKTPHTGRRAVLCLLLGAAILGVSWQVQARLGIARPFSLSPDKTAQKQDTTRKSRELSLSGHTLYALQLGAFTQESAARQMAQQYSARGAAGYVYRDGDTYRVLAAAYATRAEAQAVQTRLNGQNISTYIHPCVREALTMRAGGTGSQIDALEETLSYLDGLESKLYTLSTGLDAQTVSAEDARAALLSEGVTCAALGQRLSSAFDGALPDSLTPLGGLLDDVSAGAEAVRNENGAARIGAALKRCQLTDFFGLLRFAEGI